MLDHHMHRTYHRLRAARESLFRVRRRRRARRAPSSAAQRRGAQALTELLASTPQEQRHQVLLAISQAFDLGGTLPLTVEGRT